MLSLNDSILHVSDVCNIEKKWKGTSTSLKLWHRRLGHISRGRIERLIKNDVLLPLDFSDADKCEPLNVKSMDGFDSFITFIDDFS